MKNLKAIRIIKSLNCNLILCATEFLKCCTMGHTIIAVVKKIDERKMNEKKCSVYRPIHSMMFSTSIGDQLEYNGCQGANGSD